MTTTKRMPRFRKIDACTYEVSKTGYCVELMVDNFWDAYLPVYAPDDKNTRAYGVLWHSPRHETRENAARAVAAERRRVLRALNLAPTISKAEAAQ